jgi:Ca2+-binding RTX toxin-like protein
MWKSALTAPSSACSPTAAPANDTLVGGPGSDNLSDAFGADVMHGGAGNDNLRTSLSQNDGLVDVLDGGFGDDDLAGGDSRDIMTGGPGRDFLRGGLGPDDMDPGANTGDTVTYLDGDHNFRVVASLDANANDGNNIGGISEGDKVAAHTPVLIGGHGQDILSGSDGNNHLIGNNGDDFLEGNKGADLLEGNNGNDTLASNSLFSVPVADGAIDTLNGGDNTDSCRVPFNEADITISCEFIDAE